MRKTFKYLFTIFVILFLITMLVTSRASYLYSTYNSESVSAPPDTNPGNRYRLKPTPDYPAVKVDKAQGLQLADPANIQDTVLFDPQSGEYIISNKIGNMDYRTPRRLTLDEYQKYQLDEAKREYWRAKALNRGEGDRKFAPKYNLANEAFDKIFGTNIINIQPQGSAELIFGYNVSKIDNPTLPVRLRKTPSFNFEERIQMNVQGTIGNRVKIGMQYNTEATFEFENKTKLEYAGEEDEIIKKIEVGNITMPLSGSLITGSHSLFGIKTEMQFGKLYVTSVMSQQKGQSSTINVQGGAQTNKFEVYADQYEANKHFFLSHFFKDIYDDAMRTIPVVSSGVQITRVEVWVTNKSGQFENSRNIAAFMDLGEQRVLDNPNVIPTSGNKYTIPQNESNNMYASLRNRLSDFNTIDAAMYDGLKMGRNFEKVENARKLTDRDFTFNPALGYISLNTALNADEVLAVAYQYVYMGGTYQVGEFSTEKTNTNQQIQPALMVKLLKGTNFSPSYKNWDLMMKNIYSLNAYQISQEDFMLYVLYQNDRKGTDINYLPEERYGIEKDILLRVLNLDSLNSLGEPYPDGMFDYLEGLTINASNGRVIFPVREPFGSGLKKYFMKKTKNNTDSANYFFNKYGYQELYDSTVTKARLISEKNKFKLAGTYKSSSGSEIYLNAMNIPQGSVKVTANGVPLMENQDYTVDYALGRVKIINEGVLRSGNPIKVSLENQSLFNMQTKTLVGTNMVYKFNEDFNLGATIMHLNERPLTQKVNLYSEPISNTIWGVNGAYRTESNFITSLVDKLPFLSTKAPSQVTLMGEFAQLIPGSAKAIGKNGVAYIDDFEGSETTIELKSMPSWRLASIPFNIRYPNASSLKATTLTGEDLNINYNRAKFCWYVIDPLFTREGNSNTPKNIKDNLKAIGNDHFVREVAITELFPKYQVQNGLQSNIPVFNLAFYPRERGPYNYNPTLDSAGMLPDPKSSWGGIMRELQTTDFEASNVQYIEFWLLDPYWKKRKTNTAPASEPILVFNLGDISEDVLPDSRKSFENGLPRASVTDSSKFYLDSTKWAVVPTTPSTIKAFDNDKASRTMQDVGLDGMDNDKERLHFYKFIDAIRNSTGISQSAKDAIIADPSADDYLYFRDEVYDDQNAMILERYKKYNGLEGNSPVGDNTNIAKAASTLPDDEDINRDNTLNQSENYFEYEVPLRYNMEDNPYITSQVLGIKNDAGDQPYWYQFKVPINDFVRAIGEKQDFKSIRFLRIYLKNATDTTILRFAKLELVRGEWRKYNLSLYQGGEYEMTQNDNTNFDLTAVNIEKNSDRRPVSYVLPPGIDRVIDPTNPQIRMLNEQAMVLRVKDLADGDSRAAFKTVNLDLRQYQRLKMFIHGERIHPDKLNEGDLTVFIRIGADYKDNYYEYEIPLKPTDFPGEAGRQYDNDNNTDRLDVWPLANTVDIDLEMFQNVKLERNDKQPNDALKIYSIYDGNRKISIRGNPSLSNIRTIMIGVRNPSTTDKRGYKNDGLRKSAEVWVNELRLSDFNNKGGWGANARSQIKLADLGMISVSGSTMKPGFGSIEKKVNDREKVETNQFDVATNIDFGRFFKEEAAVQFPIYASYSKTVINPQYNPLQPDIPLDLALREAASKVERDSIKYKAQDLTSRLSVNLTNAKIGKPKQKPKFYDPANFSTTVSYNRLFSHNPTTYKNELLNYRGGLNYMFTQRAEPVQPLKNVKFLKHKAFTLIRDFNFYYKPQTVMFRTDLNRTYRRVELRNLNYIPGDNSAANKETLDPSYMRDFLWNRMYDVKFDLTRTLKLTYNGTNSSRIDEYYGEDLTNPDPRYFDSPQYKEQNRETMMNSIKHGGRNVKYMHNFDLTYTLPINKIPGFDWLSASARYGATYNWDRQPTLREGMTEYGHTIKNSNQTSLTGQANLVTLYNKVPYFKKLNQPKKKVKDVETKTVTYEQEVLVLKAKVKKTIRHNLNTEDVKVKVKDKSGAEIKGNVDVVDKNRIAFTCDEEKNNVTFVVEGKVPLKPSVVKFIVENTFKMMMGVKNIGGTYTFNQGTTLPGFNYESNILGMDPSHAWAPGLPFIFGMQDNSFYKTASDNHFDAYALSKGWLYSPSVDSLKSALNMPMIVTHNNQINLRSNVEPLPGLKIDLTAMRTYTESLSRMYLYKGDTAYSDKMMGNFSMSFLGIRTFFEKLDPAKDYESKSFNNFKALTVAKSNQLAEERLASGIDNSYAGGVYVNDSTVFPDYREGFGPTSQQVLIPSFLSAYSGMNMNNKLIKSIPLNGLFMFMPNWRLTFDGLNKIALVQKYFKSIVITHAYQATYNIGSFLSDYKYAEDELRSMDLNNNFRSKYEIGSISINESFNPLFNLDMTWVNNLTSRIGYRDMRSLIMSLYNNQLTETRSKEITVGLGYRFNEVPIKLITSAGEKNAKSDLKMQCDVSVRDDKTIFRRLIEETTSPNAGKKVVTIKFSIDYQLSSSFTMRIFYDRIYTNPFVSNAFQTTNSNVGFSVRFTLVQQQQ